MMDMNMYGGVFQDGGYKNEWKSVLGGGYEYKWRSVLGC